MKKIIVFLCVIFCALNLLAQNFNMEQNGKYYDLSWQVNEYKLYQFSPKEKKYNLLRNYNKTYDVFTLYINRSGHAMAWWQGNSFKYKRSIEFDFNKSDCESDFFGDFMDLFTGQFSDNSDTNHIIVGKMPSIYLFENGNIYFNFIEKGVKYKILIKVPTGGSYQEVIKDGKSGRFWIDR